ncbi:MAG: hypothetical protein Q9220_000439 [cf. Caloplaca sp. 1 TL-2023]
MHFIKQTISLALLGAALLATASPAPAPAPVPESFPEPGFDLDTRAVDADAYANVNVYSSSTCGGTVQSFTVQGTGANSCHPVTNAQSIQVSAAYVVPPPFPCLVFLLFPGISCVMHCTTSVWSGNNCRGNSKNIPNSSCYSVPYASVLVTC